MTLLSPRSMTCVPHPPAGMLNVYVDWPLPELTYLRVNSFKN